MINSLQVNRSFSQYGPGFSWFSSKDGTGSAALARRKRLVPKSALVVAVVGIGMSLLCCQELTEKPSKSSLVSKLK